MKKTSIAAAAGIAALLVWSSGIFVQEAAASGEGAVTDPHIVHISDVIADETDTYQSFHCPSGEALISYAAYRQIGSGPATPLLGLDFTAETYPEGVVILMQNNSGHEEGYRVSLICGDVTTL